ncbi:MAG TPA: LacI family DNA-binding transcriptional regulator [Solirubrobacteraceae bacterium]|nr:LacI family DNA-binding transcriptional regulator [Solirubrobacteraceae bacterium]
MSVESEDPPRGGPTTLRDVARRVGIHPATVSRALNENTRHLVNAETALRVAEVAREMGYRPNSIARSLKTSRSMTIGVVLPDLTNPLFPPMVRGIEDALSPAGFTALIANTDNDPARARSVVQTLRLRQVDGWISAVATRDDMFEEHGTPLVLLNRQDEVGTPAVVGDDRDGIVQAIAHLVELGHSRIACVAGPQSISTGSNRYSAYLEAMDAHRLAVDPALVRFADSWSERAGAAATRELLDGGGEFTAVLAGNDMTALGCYETLTERGLGVPDNVSVVGFNDMHFADRFDPPLTTVRIPHHEMGLRAAELLLARIAGGEEEPSHVVLPAKLVVRRSTRAPTGR